MAARKNVRERIRNGEAAVHILLDLVLAMEREASDDAFIDSKECLDPERQHKAEEVRIFEERMRGDKISAEDVEN